MSTQTQTHSTADTIGLFDEYVVPDEPFEGRVAFIEPVVSEAKRTARVRVEVDNEDGLCPLRDFVFYLAGIHIKGVPVYINEYRFCVYIGNCFCSCNKGEWSGYNFIA